jgi:hypothetical protein
MEKEIFDLRKLLRNVNLKGNLNNITLKDSYF